jgi:hypothetical protein
VTPLPTERLGMTLLGTETKRYPSGAVTMAKILCACGASFKSTLSRWRHGDFDSCPKCASKRSRGWGFGGGKQG